MSKTMLVTVSFIMLLCLSCTGDVPGPVMEGFDQKFPEATNISWGKENPHEYEASFSWNNVNYSANFSDSGEWLETENTIEFDLLPDKVREAFAASHKGAKIKAAALIETSKSETRYEIEFKKGLWTVEIFYNSEGAEIIIQ